VAALVSLVCLNLAMLPCAMGLVESEPCPDCPTTHAQEVDAHHGHTAEPAADCVNSHDDCCDVSEFSLDDRPQKPAKDGSDTFALIAGTNPARPTGAAVVVPGSTGPPDPDPGSPRIHVLNCVYLD
jgi:hypothetical protein